MAVTMRQRGPGEKPARSRDGGAAGRLNFRHGEGMPHFASKFTADAGWRRHRKKDGRAMKVSTATMLAAAGVLALAVTAPASAQGPGGGMGQGPGMGAGRGMGPGMGPGGGAVRMIEMYDSDGDGKVTKQEFDAGHSLKFDVYDVNNDGKVTREEFQMNFGGRNAQRAQQAFDRLDTNHDGVIGKDEFEDLTEIRFERVDVDKNGVITREEIDAYVAPPRAGMRPRAQ
jgi:Ca2+-binding EF-hand superfamily protein